MQQHSCINGKEVYLKGLLKSKTGIHVVEIDDVSVPAKRQILIEVKAASFNRADYYAGSLMAKEHVVGSDVAGIVRAVGEDVREFAVGDRVCAVTSHLNGGLAEYAIADEKWTARLPGNIDFVEGAAIPSAGVTALAAVEKARCSDGADVFVCGASGGVGQYAVALAKAAGAHVAAACSASNLDVPRTAGADAVFDYSNGLGDVPSNGFDAVLLVNGVHRSKDCARVLRSGGRLVLVGADALRPSILSIPFQGRKLSAATFFAIIGKDGLRRAVDVVSAAGFRPTIEEYKGFEGAERALSDLETRHPSGKIVVTLGD